MGSLSNHQPNTKSINVLVIGAGSRGTAYARAITHLAHNAGTTTRIAAIAEPDPYKRSHFGKRFIWDTDKPRYGQSFDGWEDFVSFETLRRSGSSRQPLTPPDYIPVSAALICTLDATHAPILHALAPLNLHILCEKPLALSLTDCLSIQHSLSQHPPRIFSIGHVLRYSPHNTQLRHLVCDELAIGEIISIEHTEPVGWWHFTHSYVRGNWRRETEDGVGSLLTKSCHDVDFIMWMLADPSKLTGDKVHEPSSISSTGHLTHFRKARKPKAAGDITNCTHCPLGDEGCVYSAKRIYGKKLMQDKHTGWPVNIVVPEIEEVVTAKGWQQGQEVLMQKLEENYDKTLMSDAEIAKRSWYGRCVYEADNNVVDDQTVVVSWDEHPHRREDGRDDLFGRGPKTAIFHMTYPTHAQCDRRGRIYGSLGEIAYDSKTISVYTFADQQTRIHQIDKQDPEVEEGHGGGDYGLAGNFVRAIEAVETGRSSVDDAQRRFVGGDIEEMVMSHGVVFAAEEARRSQKVVQWSEWWQSRTREVLEMTHEQEEFQ